MFSDLDHCAAEAFFRNLIEPLVTTLAVVYEALVLVASGQISLRRLDGYEKIVDVITHEEEAAA